mmetsp:Transcript_28236/g.78987  ORF Transcript_28236/g.78987 Transcript_28236/m.78987 type:complete len:258 (-) Transcript_28236:330-1103(-)|eukprot:CAMPEP_0119129352 /NCGR_PEP_ID=MMETSP1310-20130426/7138_1 /TAXON_ID=464262 /ORGANISM="Genus nov. species nov., Strain RCC2339" /LENGTH=257 /DNA_ID=CAMNT_0007119771 /DNA_START=136 /DNA_END=909 /DNA_ORIENTATION=+
MELLYWYGNFAGRGEWVRLVLHVCGFEWRDVCREEKSSRPCLELMRTYAGKESEAYVENDKRNPVMFPPILRDGDLVLNQTLAILVYLARKRGDLLPHDPVEEARCLQLMHAVMDVLAASEHAYHPAVHNASYLSQKEEAQPHIDKFVKERLPLYLRHFEEVLAFNHRRHAESVFAIGTSLTLADLCLYQLVRGYRSSLPDHYHENASSPKLRAHTAMMDEHPKIKEFLASDACTKMEAPTSHPLAEPPHVQTNSFM